MQIIKLGPILNKPFMRELRSLDNFQVWRFEEIIKLIYNSGNIPGFPNKPKKRVFPKL
jgi:hypothetical protein